MVIIPSDRPRFPNPYRTRDVVVVFGVAGVLIALAAAVAGWF